ncbi:hypothetical protein [Aliarcobacter butzleri]|uniref:Uncharacterized protein n=1 Tax=Aliarcobacter butzleri L348 TaxID=1447256 RepID=A0A0G9K0E2_9BACT|nr:hypothetical protein [Aliarcobacter butzleri]KLD99294.1 hypothetical protein AA20_07195 [Aliarcobacter butzleri L348]MCG3686481.1 XRE family transcriptional regulator [Aliarcobacter butzleri]NUW25075.1 XRE family transcriptional regulator [Aliarcobacter butzleri]
MNKQEFSDFLKDINLSKKEFAELSNISYNTVNNWNDDNRPIPPWVESWLKNYSKANIYEDLKNKVFKIENIEINRYP